MSTGNMRYERVYTQLHALNENARDLISLLEIIKKSRAASTDEVFCQKMRVARIENQIRGVNVQFNNLWKSYMGGLTKVSETYVEEATRKEEKATSGFRKLVRKMGSRSALR